jgi:hypothetical protein
MLIRTHERNTIKLHVRVFLKMNTWMFETYRKHYNWIKSLMKKSAFCWFLSHVCITMHGSKNLKYWTSSTFNILSLNLRKHFTVTRCLISDMIFLILNYNLNVHNFEIEVINHRAQYFSFRTNWSIWQIGFEKTRDFCLNFMWNNKNQY